MANSRTPSQSTYQQKRMSFYRNSNIRVPGSDKDRQYHNVFLESESTPNTNEKTYWLRKRGGLKTAGDTRLGTRVRGSISYEGSVYYILDDRFIRSTQGVSTVLATLPSNNGRNVGIVSWYDNNENEYLILGDGSTLWYFSLTTLTLTPVTAGYPTPFNPQIQSMDGYIFIHREGTNEIYNSQVGQINGIVWDFITAEMYPDTIVAFARYQNYLAALGRDSLELFYDAAIVEGSPLARNESTVLTVGCTSRWTVVQSEDTLLWVGNNQEGQLGIWQLEKFTATEISTPFIRKLLSSPVFDKGTYKAICIRHAGHRFYVLILGTPTDPFDQVWAYDIEEKFWYQWDFGSRNDFLRWGADTDQGQSLLVTPIGIVELDENTYQDLGTPIVCQWTTDPIDFDTFNRKAAHRLSLYGDVDGDSQSLQISWSDDNYRTWSTPRILPMSDNRPSLVNLGMFRRRAWRCVYEQNLPLRVEGLELYYNLMGN